MLLTILMPCLNEEDSIKFCIEKAKLFLNNSKIDGEILVIDNGCTDKSINIALREEVRVVKEPRSGYGLAVRKGIDESRGKYIIMGDCDGSYDFENLSIFMDKLQNGYDFVCGNRFKGGICKGAMPLSHKIGVPILSYIAKLKYKVPLNDFHCGLRGFRSDLAKQCSFTSDGMEFATELIEKFRDTSIIEVPIILYKDKRKGKSHLRTIKDGLRHLKFIMKS